MTLQLTLIASIMSLVLGLFGGYEFEKGRFDAFKLEVEIAGAKAQAKVEEEKKNDSKITEDVASEYRNALGSLQHNTGSRIVSSVSKAAGRANETTAYTVLAEDCRATTLQLEYLQKWVNLQYEDDK